MPTLDDIMRGEDAVARNTVMVLNAFYSWMDTLDTPPKRETTMPDTKVPLGQFASFAIEDDPDYPGFLSVFGYTEKDCAGSGAELAGKIGEPEVAKMILLAFTATLGA